MKIECPECGVSGSVDESYSGRKIRCPQCGEVFRCATLAESSDTVVQEPGARGRMKEDDQPSKQDHHGEEDELSSPLLDFASTGRSPVTIPDIPNKEKSSAGTAARETRESFSLGATVSRSWELTRGAKGQIWVALLVMLVILAAVEGIGRIAEAVFGVNVVYVIDGQQASMASLIYDFISSGLSTILTAGLMFMGVKWVRDGQINWKDLFSGFPTALSLLVVMVLEFILLVIGFFLLILPGIYLTVGYSLALPLIVDRRMSPWQALETSRKAVHKVWWKMFGLMLVMLLIVSLSAVPFGIGLIWTVPMTFVLSGLVYTYLFPESVKG